MTLSHWKVGFCLSNIDHVGDGCIPSLHKTRNLGVHLGSMSVFT